MSIDIPTEEYNILKDLAGNRHMLYVAEIEYYCALNCNKTKEEAFAKAVEALKELKEAS